MRDIISSSNNNYIKQINKFSKKKYRSKQNAFLIETHKLIDEALESGMHIKQIFARADVDSKYENTIFIEEKLFNDLSSLVTPDGYMATVEKKESLEVSDKILILDGIQDPGNLGTLIRSAEAFGFNTIVSISSVDFYNEKVLRATMGSIFRLNLIEADYKFVSQLKDYTIFIGNMNGEDYRSIDYPKKLCLVIGNEGNGISEQMQTISHKTIMIPMQGQIESLNAGVSGSLLMANISKE